MAAPDKGPGGDKRNDWQRIKAWVTKWADLDAAIKEFADIDNPPQGIKDMRKQRKELSERIQSLVSQKPKLWDVAVNQGFNEDLLEKNVPASTTPQAAGAETVGGQNQPIEPSGQRSPTGGGGKSSGGGRRNRGGGGVDHLAGKRGRDWQVARYGGRTYIVFKADIGKKGGKKVLATWRVPRNLLDRYGLSENEGRQLTKTQFKKLNVFGTINELKLKGRHPVTAWLDRMGDLFGISPAMLRNKGVMSVLMEAHFEKWDAARLQNALAQTPFFKKKTELRTQWITQLTPGEREHRIETAFNRLVEFAQDAFGPVDWMDHVKRDQLRDWAENAASGKRAWDEDTVRTKLTRKARAIEGTTAWAEQTQAEAATRGVTNKPEEVFEQLRGEALSYLGYAADDTPLLSRETLKGWANDIATGAASEHDWSQFLRQQMKVLHPHFDANIPWQDQIDPFRAQLEQIIGTSVSYGDQFLRSVSGTDPNGKPTGAPMSLYDYAQFVRDNDPRFWDNPRTEERGRQFAQGVLAKMTGGS